MNYKFFYREGFFQKCPAQEIGEAILLRAGQEKMFKLLEKDARKKSHALHSWLTWDDKVGGLKNRIREISDHVRMLRVKKRGQDKRMHTIRAFHNVNRGSGIYLDVNEVFADTDFAKQVIGDAKNLLKQLINKCNTLNTMKMSEEDQQWADDFTSGVKDLKWLLEEKDDGLNGGTDDDEDGGDEAGVT